MEIHWIDLTIFIIYLFSMLGIGFFFYRKNESKEDYYVGKREMSAGHIGLSVVATDVGGGFSIGLGGLGFVMGISGSWMLFTGILGAWLSIVFLIPKVYSHGKNFNFLSFPQLLEHYYDKRPALIAGVISFIGYVGFTSSQILAGAKLASATFQVITTTEAVLMIGIIAIVYTVAGGLKAVVYTDTVQWIILMSGLILIAIPFGYFHLGGWAGISGYLPPGFFSLTNISLVQIINWMITIVPIWFIGMTLYQRIYACKDEKTAKKAWLIAGLFEWPVMAFLGTLLGLFGRVALEQGLLAGMGYSTVADIDSEIALPVFLRHILPYHENKVTLNREVRDKWGMPTLVFDCSFKENELNMRKDMQQQAAEMLEAAGAKNVQTYDQLGAPGLGIHEMGTARMGRDPKTSVLNKHNQVWDAPNVFVTDGASMASAACQNPSLTYMALTARAADFAVSELKKMNL